ncbi:MAG TPA: FliH/SctL family protein, partial [Telluria sp.]
DEDMARGGCRVDTASNQIDAQIASRWQRLAHALGKDLDWLA